MDMYKQSMGELIGQLVETFEIGDEPRFVVVVRERVSKKTKGHVYKLEDIFNSACVRELIDVLRYEDIDSAVLYAFSKDRDMGTKALEIAATNLIPFNIRDAVWTDKKKHGHWGGRGDIHYNPGES